MNSIDFGYSLKNILLSSMDSYKYTLIEKTEQLLKMMKWKEFFYNRDNTNKYNNKNNTYVEERPITDQKKSKKVSSANTRYERF